MSIMSRIDSAVLWWYTFLGYGVLIIQKGQSMDTENRTKAPLTVRAEIDQMLAALTPEQLVAPQMAREPDAHFVCIANDEIKRLYTLRNQLNDECRKLSLDAIRMGEAAKRRVLSGEGILEVLNEMRTPGSPALKELENMRRAHSELKQTFGILKIVTEALRLETFRQHDDLAEKSEVLVYSDWSICWKEGSSDDSGVIAKVLIRGAPDEPGQTPPKRLLH